jgi:hypothetical protein
MSKIVCWICRHQQHFASGLRAGEGSRGRYSRLANAPFATKEQYFFGLRKF